MNLLSSWGGLVGSLCDKVWILSVKVGWGVLECQRILAGCNMSALKISGKLFWFNMLV